MIALAAIVLGLSLGIACGGSARGLETLSLRFEWPVLLLFVVQGIARGRIGGANASAFGLGVWAASCIILIVLLVPDWRRVGIWVLGVGLALNLLVVLANGGMPVLLNDPMELSKAGAQIARSMGFYQLAGPGTALALLGDVLPLDLGAYRVLLSPGDVLLLVGVAALICSSMSAHDGRAGTEGV
jgi:hypothetical protein